MQNHQHTTDILNTPLARAMFLVHQLTNGELENYCKKLLSRDTADLKSKINKYLETLSSINTIEDIYKKLFYQVMESEPDCLVQLTEIYNSQELESENKRNYLVRLKNEIADQIKSQSCAIIANDILEKQLEIKEVLKNHTDVVNELETSKKEIEERDETARYTSFLDEIIAALSDYDFLSNRKICEPLIKELRKKNDIKEFFDYLKCLTDGAQQLDKNSVYAKLKKIYNDYQHDSNKFQNKYAEIYRNFRTKLKNLTAIVNPKLNKKVPSVLEINTHNIVWSQLELNLDNIKEIRVTATGNVYFDSDIKYNGINLIIYAASVHAKDNVTIDTSGLPGEPHKQKQAKNGCEKRAFKDTPSGERGDDGQHGKPGMNAGDVYIWTNEFKGLENLTINATGGKGGDGQSGGDGDKGIPGRDGNDGNAKDKSSIFTRGCTLKKATNDLKKMQGGKGGNGGNAGLPGLGGHGGNVSIKTQTEDLTQKVTVHKEKGGEGEKGAIGKGGSEGENGTIGVDDGYAWLGWSLPVKSVHHRGKLEKEYRKWFWGKYGSIKVVQQERDFKEEFAKKFDVERGEDGKVPQETEENKRDKPADKITSDFILLAESKKNINNSKEEHQASEDENNELRKKISDLEAQKNIISKNKQQLELETKNLEKVKYSIIGKYKSIKQKINSLHVTYSQERQQLSSKKSTECSGRLNEKSFNRRRHSTKKINNNVYNGAPIFYPSGSVNDNIKDEANDQIRDAIDKLRNALKNQNISNAIREIYESCLERMLYRFKKLSKEKQSLAKHIILYEAANLESNIKNDTNDTQQHKQSAQEFEADFKLALRIATFSPPVDNKKLKDILKIIDEEGTSVDKEINVLTTLTNYRATNKNKRPEVKVLEAKFNALNKILNQLKRNKQNTTSHQLQIVLVNRYIEITRAKLAEHCKKVAVEKLRTIQFPYHMNSVKQAFAKNSDNDKVDRIANYVDDLKKIISKLGEIDPPFMSLEDPYDIYSIFLETLDTITFRNRFINTVTDKLNNVSNFNQLKDKNEKVQSIPFGERYLIKLLKLNNESEEISLAKALEEQLKKTLDKLNKSNNGLSILIKKVIVSLQVIEFTMDELDLLYQSITNILNSIQTNTKHSNALALDVLFYAQDIIIKQYHKQFLFLNLNTRMILYPNYMSVYTEAILKNKLIKIEFESIKQLLQNNLYYLGLAKTQVYYQKLARIVNNQSEDIIKVKEALQLLKSTLIDDIKKSAISKMSTSHENEKPKSIKNLKSCLEFLLSKYKNITPRINQDLFHHLNMLRISMDQIDINDIDDLMKILLQFKIKLNGNVYLIELIDEINATFRNKFLDYVRNSINDKFIESNKKNKEWYGKKETVLIQLKEDSTYNSDNIDMLNLALEFLRYELKEKNYSEGIELSDKLIMTIQKRVALLNNSTESINGILKIIYNWSYKYIIKEKIDNIQAQNFNTNFKAMLKKAVDKINPTPESSKLIYELINILDKTVKDYSLAEINPLLELLTIAISHYFCIPLETYRETLLNMIDKIYKILNVNGPPKPDDTNDNLIQEIDAKNILEKLDIDNSMNSEGSDYELFKENLMLLTISLPIEKFKVLAQFIKTLEDIDKRNSQVYHIELLSKHPSDRQKEKIESGRLMVIININDNYKLGYCDKKSNSYHEKTIEDERLLRDLSDIKVGNIADSKILKKIISMLITCGGKIEGYSLRLKRKTNIIESYFNKAYLEISNIQNVDGINQKFKLKKLIDHQLKALEQHNSVKLPKFKQIIKEISNELPVSVKAEQPSNPNKQDLFNCLSNVESNNRNDLKFILKKWYAFHKKYKNYQKLQKFLNGVYNNIQQTITNKKTETDTAEDQSFISALKVKTCKALLDFMNIPNREESIASVSDAIRIYMCKLSDNKAKAPVQPIQLTLFELECMINILNLFPLNLHEILELTKLLHSQEEMLSKVKSCSENNYQIVAELCLLVEEKASECISKIYHRNEADLLYKLLITRNTDIVDKCIKNNDLKKGESNNTANRVIDKIIESDLPNSTLKYPYKSKHIEPLSQDALDNLVMQIKKSLLDKIFNKDERFLFDYYIYNIENTCDSLALINCIKFYNPNTWLPSITTLVANKFYFQLLENHESTLTDNIKKMKASKYFISHSDFETLTNLLEALNLEVKKGHQYSSDICDKLKSNILLYYNKLNPDTVKDLSLENLVACCDQLIGFKHNFNRNYKLIGKDQDITLWIKLLQILIKKYRLEDSLSNQSVLNINEMNNILFEITNLTITKELMTQLKGKKIQNWLQFILHKRCIECTHEMLSISNQKISEQVFEGLNSLKSQSELLLLLQILLDKIKQQKRYINKAMIIKAKKLIEVFKLLKDINLTEEFITTLARVNLQYWDKHIKRHVLEQTLPVIGNKSKLRHYCKLQLYRIGEVHGSEIRDELLRLLIMKAGQSTDRFYENIKPIFKKILKGKWRIDTIILKQLENLKLSDWKNKIENYTSECSQCERDANELIKIIINDPTNSELLGYLKCDQRKLDDFLKQLHNSLNNPIANESKTHSNDNNNKPINEWTEDLIKQWAQSVCDKGDKDWVQNNIPEVLAVISRAVYLTTKKCQKILSPQEIALTDKKNGGFYPRDTQYLSLYLFLYTQNKGCLGQIATGEGKTLITAMLAITKVLLGEKVDVITSNKVLAERDAKAVASLFDLFNLKVANNCDDECQKSIKERQSRYNSHVVYGHIGSFQNDILLTKFYQKDILKDRNTGSVIVDEVDSMLLDNSETVLYLSHEIPDLRHLENLYICIWLKVKAIGALELEPEEKIDAINKNMLESIEKGEIAIPQYLKQFVKYRLPIWIKNALAANIMKEDDPYRIALLENSNDYEKIVPIDKNTGVEQVQMQYCNGLQQFLQFKHCRKFVAESLKAVYMSNLAYFSQFKGKIYGLTGTLGSEMERIILAENYDVNFFQLPRYKSRRFTEKDAVIINAGYYFEEIRSEDGTADETIVGLSLEAKNALKNSIPVYKLIYTARDNKWCLNRYTDLNEKPKSVLANELTKILKNKVLKDIEERDLDDIEKEIKLNEDRCNNTEQKWLEAIMDEIKSMAKSERSVLVICENRNSVNMLKAYIEANKFDLENTKLEYYDSALDEFTLSGSEKNPVTPRTGIIATNIAGRGMDLIIDKDVADKGGLHVILSYIPDSKRVEDQAFGRAARKGEKGSGQFIIHNKEKNLNLEELLALRDIREAERLDKVVTEKLPATRISDGLFVKFIELNREVKQILSTSDLKSICPKNEDQYIEIQLTSLKNRWAFWLDSMEEVIEKVYITGQEKIYEDFEEFKKAILADLHKDDYYKLIESSHEKARLLIYFLQVNLYENAINCADNIINAEPNFSAIAHFYKAQALSKQPKHKKPEVRKKIKKELIKAKSLFQEEIMTLTQTYQLLEKVKRIAQKQGSGLSSNQYRKQIENKVNLLGLHIRSIDEVIGRDLDGSLLRGITLNDERLLKVNYYLELVKANTKNDNVDFSQKAKMAFDKGQSVYVLEYAKANLSWTLKFYKTENAKEPEIHHIPELQQFLEDKTYDDIERPVIPAEKHSTNQQNQKVGEKGKEKINLSADIVVTNPNLKPVKYFIDSWQSSLLNQQIFDDLLKQPDIVRGYRLNKHVSVKNNEAIEDNPAVKQLVVNQDGHEKIVDIPIIFKPYKQQIINYFENKTKDMTTVKKRLIAEKPENYPHIFMDLFITKEEFWNLLIEAKVLTEQESKLYLLNAERSTLDKIISDNENLKKYEQGIKKLAKQNGNIFTLQNLIVMNEDGFTSKIDTDKTITMNEADFSDLKKSLLENNQLITVKSGELSVKSDNEGKLELPDKLKPYRHLIDDLVKTHQQNPSYTLLISYDDIPLLDDKEQACCILWECLRKQQVIKDPKINISLKNATGRYDIEAKLEELNKIIESRVRKILQKMKKDIISKNKKQINTIPDLSEPQKKMLHVVNVSANVYETVKEETFHFFDSSVTDKYVKLIQSALKKSIGILKTSPDFKLNVKNLELFFQKGEYPPEIYEFHQILLGQVINFDEVKSWWDWRSFSIAMFGIAQITVGIMINIYSGIPLLNPISSLFINEGIGDVIFGITSGLTKSFSWNSYIQHKKVSSLFSLLSFGFNVLPLAVNPAKLATQATTNGWQNLAITAGMKIAREATTATACGLSNLAIAELTKRLPREIMAHLGNFIRSRVNEDENIKSSTGKLLKNMLAINSACKGNTEKAKRIIADALRNSILSQKSIVTDTINKTVLNIAQHLPTFILQAADKIATRGLSVNTHVLFKIVQMVIQFINDTHTVHTITNRLNENLADLNNKLKSAHKDISGEKQTYEINPEQMESFKQYANNLLNDQIKESISEVIERISQEWLQPKLQQATNDAIHFVNHIMFNFSSNNKSATDKSREETENQKLEAIIRLSKREIDDEIRQNYPNRRIRSRLRWQKGSSRRQYIGLSETDLNLPVRNAKDQTMRTLIKRHGRENINFYRDGNDNIVVDTLRNSRKRGINSRLDWSKHQSVKRNQISSNNLLGSDKFLRRKNNGSFFYSRDRNNHAFRRRNSNHVHRRRSYQRIKIECLLNNKLDGVANLYMSHGMELPDTVAQFISEQTQIFLQAYADYENNKISHKIRATAEFFTNIHDKQIKFYDNLLVELKKQLHALIATTLANLDSLERLDKPNFNSEIDTVLIKNEAEKVLKKCINNLSNAHSLLTDYFKSKSIRYYYLVDDLLSVIKSRLNRLEEIKTCREDLVKNRGDINSFAIKNVKMRRLAQNCLNALNNNNYSKYSQLLKDKNMGTATFMAANTIDAVLISVKINRNNDVSIKVFLIHLLNNLISQKKQHSKLNINILSEDLNTTLAELNCKYYVKAFELLMNQELSEEDRGVKIAYLMSEIKTRNKSMKKTRRLDNNLFVEYNKAQNQIISAIMQTVAKFSKNPNELEEFIKKAENSLLKTDGSMKNRVEKADGLPNINNQNGAETTEAHIPILSYTSRKTKVGKSGQQASSQSRFRGTTFMDNKQIPQRMQKKIENFKAKAKEIIDMYDTDFNMSRVDMQVFIKLPSVDDPRYGSPLFTSEDVIKEILEELKVYIMEAIGEQDLTYSIKDNQLIVTAVSLQKTGDVENFLREAGCWFENWDAKNKKVI